MILQYRYYDISGERISANEKVRAEIVETCDITNECDIPMFREYITRDTVYKSEVVDG